MAGAAVDLTLADVDGTELPMGTGVNADPDSGNGTCYTDSLAIPPQARTNRLILADALETAGFVNYPTEWWHWSYGDRYWTFIKGHAVARYGPVTGFSP